MNGNKLKLSKLSKALLKIKLDLIISGLLITNITIYIWLRSEYIYAHSLTFINI